MRTVWLKLAFSVVLAVTPCTRAQAQAGFDNDRVMLQGFYWESCRHGNPGRFPQFGDKKWYVIVGENAEMIRQARFDLIWLPPPCYSADEKRGDLSAGYAPKQYFKLDNSYGSFAQHRTMLEALLQRGIEPVADIVINHRGGNTGWVDFKNPDWGLWAICADDEAFSKPEFAGIPMSQRGAPEERPIPYGVPGNTDYAYPAYRDLDHTNPQVRRDIIRYLLMLKSFGYRGWRHDMVHGYHARWVALYNKRSNPTFSVGEYDWAKHAESRGWVWWTATTPNDLRTASSVFDFSTRGTLKNNKSNYAIWTGFGNGLGMVGDTADGQPWKQRAVTFLENHDTGYRTREDGSFEDQHQFDSFANTWEVEQAYAYILTHPGVPCVFWKHYFDWGNELRYKIRALINARKIAGVKSGSALSPQDNARQKGVYAAMVAGLKGDLYVRIGGSDADWQPSYSNYKDYREYAYSAGSKVWVKLPSNPDLRQAPLKSPIPVPQFQPADQINIPAEWANP
ncbi:MAG: alpha-amylase family glycosyl hydrolase [Isosphaeraceae bacterium]